MCREVALARDICSRAPLLATFGPPVSVLIAGRVLWDALHMITLPSSL